MYINLVVFAILIMYTNGCDSLIGSGHKIHVAWEVEAESGINGMNGVPSTDGERFFALDRKLVAYNVETGAVEWQSSPLRSFRPLYTSVYGGRVFLAESEAVALDAESGRELWRVALRESASLAEPGADDGAFYTVDRGRRAYALDTRTGAVRWTVDVGSDWWGGDGRGTAAADGIVYVAVERSYPPNGFLSQGVVVALDAQTGRELWRYTNGDGTTSRNVIGAPVVADDLLLLADLRGHFFIGLDRTTGRERWRVETTPGFAGPAQPPTVRDGIGYATAPDALVYAIDLATGRVLWKAAPRETSSGIYHAVCGGVVLSNHFSVVATERATGRVLSRDVYSSGTATSAFAVAGTRAFFVGREKAVALDCP